MIFILIKKHIEFESYFGNYKTLRLYVIHFYRA